MPIQSLSGETSRQLTSAQTLNSATSVIKELVDNALDAHASSILIEISANTLDRIIVKDDGSGIGVQDRQLLCKRGCTSKIANMDDLANLGGSFLGFRGTALACIAEMSKSVTVVTKVDGEQRATTMTFGPDGTLLSSASASHNNGTTVKVDHFLSRLPVRQQAVLKAPSKVLDDIKKLLQSYAVARPGVQFTLKILKAKNDKFNWSFASCKDENALLSAAIQVAGTAVVNLCKLHTANSGDNATDVSKYKVEALVLEASNQDLSPAAGSGQYLSVDGRPVSQDKDPMKTIIKSYKQYLQQVAKPGSSIRSKPFLIAHLHCPKASYDINLEPAKDVVLFHEKNEVLSIFERLFQECYGPLEANKSTSHQVNSTDLQSSVSGSFDLLLARKRPENYAKNTNSFAQENVEQSNQGGLSDAVPLGERPTLVEEFASSMNDPSMSLFGRQNDDSNALSAECTLTPSRVHQNMYTIEDELPLQKETDELENEFDEDDYYDADNVTLNNPFVRAKINSKAQVSNFDQRKPAEKTDAEHLPPRRATTLSSGEDRSSPIHRVSLNQIYKPLTPSPSPYSSGSKSYQNPGPPFPRRPKGHLEAEEIDHEDLDEMAHTQQPRQPNILVNWIKLPPSSNLTSTSANLQLGSDKGWATQSHALGDQRRDLVSTSSNSLDSQRAVNRPFRSPVKAKMLTDPRSGKDESIPQSRDIQPISPGVTRLPQNDDDLQHILDFEKRKKIANERMRTYRATLDPTGLAQIQQRLRTTADVVSSKTSPTGSTNSESESAFSSVEPITNSLRTGGIHQGFPTKGQNPHHNRYLAAVQNLQTNTKGKNHANREDVHNGPQSSSGHSSLKLMPSEKPLGLPDSDARGYLMSQRRGYATVNLLETKMKRTKTSRLPFEKIAFDDVKHNLLVTPSDLFPKSIEMCTLCENLARSDSYVRRGIIEPIVWTPGMKSMDHWQRELEHLVKSQYTPSLSTDKDTDISNEHMVNITIPLARVIQAYINSA